jgi:hypothetical protein
MIEIARCPHVQRCLTSDAPHECRRVVIAQGLIQTRHQLPEPWSGRIETAPLLFIGSNPSFNRYERFPTKGWANQTIEAFFTTRFEGGLPPVRYWSVVRSIARAILGEEPRPGHDFALTELVRCKSLNEKGVRQALGTCSELYLERTLEVAGAKVVIALGKVARQGIASHIGGTSEIGLRRGRFDIGGHKRAVLLLGHPSSGQRQTPTDAEVKRLRTVLQGRDA